MENGKLNGWARWLVGILFTILFTAFTTLTTAVIANDKDSRDRDTKMAEQMVSCVRDITHEIKIDKEKQMIVNQQILVALARIEAEIKR